jgi:hypothetical protein
MPSTLTEFIATLTVTTLGGTAAAVFIWPKREWLTSFTFVLMACFVGCCTGVLMADMMIDANKVKESDRALVSVVCCLPYYFWFIRMLSEYE